MSYYRAVTGCSTHAIERYQIVDPAAGRYAVLDECERAARLDKDLALSVRAAHLDGNASRATPADGYLLHRHGRCIFACVEKRDYPNQLYCVTALRLSDQQREILRGYWSPWVNPYDSVDVPAYTTKPVRAAPTVSEEDQLENALGSTGEHVTNPFDDRALPIGYLPSTLHLGATVSRLHRGAVTVWIRLPTADNLGNSGLNNAAPEVSSDGAHLLIHPSPGYSFSAIKAFTARAQCAGLPELRRMARRLNRIVENAGE